MDARELGHLPALLASVRRRLRVAWALDSVQVLAPVVAAVALVLVGTAWVGPWSIPGERIAVIVAVATLGVVVAVALALRLPDSVVARRADRGLRTKDAFSTALEVPADVEPFGPRIRERAASLAESGTAQRAVGLPWRRRPVLVAAALVPVIVALSVATSPRDDELAEAAATAADLAAAQETLAEAAAELRDEPVGEEAAERLDELAERLETTEDLATAEELLRQEADAMDLAQRPDALAERAASQGLERSLAGEPLPGSDAAASAAEQFEQLGEEAGSMTPEEMEAAAERLDDLAATQEAGNADAAAALAAAAEALRNGDTAAASAALGDAAAAQQQATASAASTAALGEAAAAARQAAGEVGAASGEPGEGQGEGQGQGQGQGQGEGQGDGQGQGGGEGQGQGQGQGQGGGGGGCSGANCGASSDGDGASGQGSNGRVSGDGDETNAQDDETPDLDTVYDPVAGGESDELTVGGGQGQGEGGTVGASDGPTQDGQSRVPIADAVTDYAREATEAMDGAVVAPSDRQLVTDYFDQLQNRS